MNNKEDFREYCKMLIALFESGDQESIDIYHKIQRYARDNSLYAQRENDDYIQLRGEEEDKELAKELDVSVESLKKAFKLFQEIGLVELCSEEELDKKGDKHGKQENGK